MELLNFEKPARYIGREWNVVKKCWDEKKVKVCLIYPEIYEIGESNLGLKILYDVLNELQYVICERSYMPSNDMIEYLKEKDIPLFSLENKKSISDFDILGFSLQSELAITNVIEILKLSKIPVLSSDREDFPLVLGGGNITLNPLPFKDFFDFLFIGEAEEGIVEFVEKFYELREDSKENILKEISRIDGFYVPSFSGVVRKRYVDINRYLYPKNYIVPVIGTVHDRLNVEIMRGCSRKCKFCQARVYYSPYRIREKNNILDMVFSLLKKTGYEEVSLAGLNVTEHPEIDEIIDELMEKFRNNNTSLSLPSLRPDLHSLRIARKLMELKRINLTFAPESPYREIRKIFGKDFDEDEFLRGLRSFKNLGVRRIKLYFILGLPGVSFEEVYELYRMISNWKKITGLSFSVNCSFFVPKAHSMFERERFKDMDILREERNFLKRKLKNMVKFSCLEESFLEAVFSRGDEKLNRVILTAYEKGCKFDGWNEVKNFNLWMDAFDREGINPFDYAYKEYPEEEIPWNFIKIC